MEPSSYANNLLNLKKDVLYVMLTEPTTGTTMGKILDRNARRQFNTNNPTCAMLLYLLARDDNDDIHFNTLKQLVQEKYDLSETVAAEKIDLFLGHLDSLYETKGVRGKTGILDKKDANTNIGTVDPDPCKLFEISATWDEGPSLRNGTAPPIHKKGHHYGCGNGASTVWR